MDLIQLLTESLEAHQLVSDALRQSADRCVLYVSVSHNLPH